MRCWSCREPVGGPVCPGCGVIQAPPARPDLFALLGLPRRYHLDDREIDRAFRQTSRKVHPDRFAGKKALERRMSLQWTSFVNKAHRVLKDPLARAHYLASGLTRPAEAGGPQLDPDFLEEIFELQMMARVEPEDVRARATAMRDALLAELDHTFTRWEAGEGDLQDVEERLARLRYLGTALDLVEH